MDRMYRLQVVPFSPEYAVCFEEINRQWIERYFILEENDRALFRDPYGVIVKPGGQIFFAVARGQVVGTCAVIRHSDRLYELAKMAVRPETRGRGVGSQLVKAAVDFARRAGAHTLMLLSNTRLEAALRLYARHGFREVPVRNVHGYARVDVQMELNLGREMEETGC